MSMQLEVFDILHADKQTHMLKHNPYKVK